MSTVSLLGFGAVVAMLFSGTAMSSEELPYYFSSFAGARGRSGSQDGIGSAARFGYPPVGGGLAVDADGVAYFSDSWNHTIRRIAPSGAVTTFAGSPGRSGMIDAIGTKARFNHPEGLVIDSAGNILVADTGNSRIRRITPDGVVTTIPGGDGGEVPFASPMDLAIDTAGNIYVSDTGNYLIRRIEPSGHVTTIAGGMNPNTNENGDGEGPYANFRSPTGIVVDSDGTIYVADYGYNTIRRISTTNLVTTLAGNPGSYLGHADGLGVFAEFWGPIDLCFDSNGALLVADQGNSTLRRVTLDGFVTTVAGQPQERDTVDGVDTDARFYWPYALARGVDQSVYVADSDLNSVILRKGIPAIATPPSVLAPPESQTVVTGESTTFRVIGSGYTPTLTYQWQRAPVESSVWEDLADDPTINGVTASTLEFSSIPLTLAGSRFRCIISSGVGEDAVSPPATLRVLPVATEYAFTTTPHYTGTPQSGSDADGPGPFARFSGAKGLAIDHDGNLIVADADNYTIRRVAPDASVTTLAGKAHQHGVQDGAGDAARFGSESFAGPVGPGAVAIDAVGNIVVADTGNSRIRKITPAGVVTTTAIGLSPPVSVAVDRSGNILFTAQDRQDIRRIDPAGNITTWAGATTPGTTDGPRLQARFNAPTGLVFDAAGNLYVADRDNHTIRMVSTNGNVYTFAGIPGIANPTDGFHLNATFHSPIAIAIDSKNNLFVADRDNNVIRRIDTNDMVSTWVGNALSPGRRDGEGETSGFLHPTALTIDETDNLYVIDGEGATIRKVSPTRVVTTIAGNSGGEYGGLFEVGQLSIDAVGNLYGVGRNSSDSEVEAWTMRPDFQITFLTSPNPYYSESVEAVTASRDEGVFIGATDALTQLYMGAPVIHGYVARFGIPGYFVPLAMAIDDNRNLFVLISGGSSPLKLSPEGTKDFVAGSYASPRGLTTDADGNLYVADTDNHAIRKLAPDGVFSTVAGQPGSPGSTDGTTSTALFNLPRGVAISRGGTIFVADTGNHTIRRITPDGMVSTIGGTANTPGISDGAGSAAHFNSPSSVAVGDDGTLFVADTGNHALRIGTPVLASSTAPAITSQPTDINVTAGSTATLALVAESALTIDYAWQRRSPGGEWSDLLDNATFAGTASTELTINDVTLALDGAEFRCIAQNGLGSPSKSASATLEVTPLAGTVSLANLVQPYDGTPKAVTATATPVELAIEVTYNGSATAPSSVGSYDVVATIRDSHYAGTATGTLQIQPVLTPGQTGTVATSAGGATALSVAVAGSSQATFQWQWEQPVAAPADKGTLVSTWVDIPGATASTYAIPSTQRFSAGTYRVVVTENGVSVSSEPFVVQVAAVTPNNARLLNLSTRAQSLAGDDILIPGFVIGGTGTKKLLIRAIGPTLSHPPFNIATALDNPRMTLKRLDYSQHPAAYVDVVANDDWMDNANATDIAQAIDDLFAFGFQDDHEAALLVDLTPGQYTVFADGVNNATGVAIVELYDADTPNPAARLINISNRGFVGTGDNVMIPGFVVSSEGPKTLLIRVVGPTLAGTPFNVPGTMADPKLEIFPAGSGTPILTQDNWGDNPDAAYTAQVASDVSAFALSEGSADAAFVVTLEPGTYSVVGSSADGVSTGVVLVEVYVVP